MEIKYPDKDYPGLSRDEVVKCATEIEWRKLMLRENRLQTLEAEKQTLLLEQLVSAVGGNGEKLEQVREHLAHWEVQ